MGRDIVRGEIAGAECRATVRCNLKGLPSKWKPFQEKLAIVGRSLDLRSNHSDGKVPGDCHARHLRNGESGNSLDIKVLNDAAHDRVPVSGGSMRGGTGLC